MVTEGEENGVVRDDKGGARFFMTGTEEGEGYAMLLTEDGVPLTPPRTYASIYEITPSGTPEAELVKVLKNREWKMDLHLGAGDGDYTVWTCDLTYDYVKINADYHT